MTARSAACWSGSAPWRSRKDWRRNDSYIHHQDTTDTRTKAGMFSWCRAGGVPGPRNLQGTAMGVTDSRVRVVHLVLSLDVGGLEKVVLNLTHLATQDVFEARVL